MRGSERLLYAGTIIAGVALVVIGIRFFAVPLTATRFFGLTERPQGTELHTVIALRDIWLGVLALALLVLREWRALALWFAFGTCVCLCDAVLVFQSTGKLHAIGFHVISGLACGLLAAGCWKRQLEI